MKPYFFWTTGVFWVAFWPQLPVFFVGICIALAGVLCFSKQWTGIAWLLLGMVFAIFHGQSALEKRLPIELDKTDVTVSGKVVGLPAKYQNRYRFEFQVAQFAGLQSGDHRYFSRPRRILLSWYYPTDELYPDQPLTLQVRLRHPRGSANPGGFDYPAWLLRKGLTATGYVREVIDVGARPASTGLFNISQWRNRIQQSIVQLDMDEEPRALLVALTVGDKQQLTTDAWQRYARAGVVHLLVISGLHIGFAALLGYFPGMLMGRLANLRGERVIAQHWGAVVSLFTAGFYAALAGWSIPTQRAFVMVLVAVVARLSCRHISRGFGFSVALVAVATLDPLAVLDKGFWLSFSAVAVLLWLLPDSRQSRKTPVQNIRALDESEQGVAISTINGLQQLALKGWMLFKIQCVISLLLVVILLITHLPVSLLGPLINMVAIPWVSTMIVPFCLLGALLLPLWPSVSVVLWQVAGFQLGWFARFIHLAADWQQQLFAVLPVLPTPTTVLEKFSWMLAVLLLFLPFGQLSRIPGLVILLALLMSEPDKPDLKLTVLDVGQGLSVVVQTPHHTLVYDAGAAFNERLNAGNAIVVPYLRSEGRHSLDALVVSHNDSDHAGGVAGILDNMAVDKLIVGQPVDLPSRVGKPMQKTCLHRNNWQWDNVQFQLVSPITLTGPENSGFFSKDNNHSCLLLISYADTDIFLPGDIEKSIEPYLIPLLSELSPLSVLIAPHHGSNSSSTRQFVEAVLPEYVVFSAGFNHHFGHPHPAVQARYRKAGAELLNTADSGAIEFVWDGSELKSVRPFREAYRRYWY